MRRTVRILALLALLSVLGTLAVAAPAGATDDADEWAFVDLINQSRAAAGLAPLGVLANVRDIARGWSAQMGRENLLHHNPNMAAQVGGAVPDWGRIGENVGKGYDVAGLHQAFMNSAGHRANVLGDYTYMAVGVTHVNGITWVTENFVKAAPGKATIAPTPLPPPPPPIPVDRIAGPSDGDTSVAVAGRFPDGGSDAVVVGRSDVFADALAGGPLAAVSNGPVLLTSPTSASSATLAEARRVLKPGGTVYLLGGLTALSDNVERAFTGAGLRVERIAGADRYDTAVQVARRVNLAPTEVIVVSGTNFADAMVTGPVAALRKAPLVLSAPNGMPSPSAAYLASVPAARRTVIGGVAAVPENALAAAGTVDRIAGADRYETAVKVAQRFFPTAAQLSFATGVTFQDALSGAAFSARSRIPLVLVSSSPTPATCDYVKSQVARLDSSIVYGTSNAVPDAAVSKLFV